jgi:DtxR family Mn-dependent transcriptional regulator
MLQRLDDRGFVANEFYEGTTLTADGRKRAEELHETFVTPSRFFRDVLELDAHEKAAMSLAGTLNPAVADRLDATLLADPESTPTERSPTPDSE